MELKLNIKQHILSLIFIVISLTLNIVGLVASQLFVSWIVFFGLGFAIFVIMTNIPKLINKDVLGLVLLVAGIISLVLSIIGIFSFIEVAQKFIATMI